MGGKSKLGARSAHPNFGSGGGSAPGSVKSNDKLLVATRGAWAAQGANGRSNGSITAGTGRVQHVAKTDCTDIVATFANGRFRDDTLGDNDITIKFTIEKADGTKYPAYFGGQRAITLKPGAVIDCDPVPIVLSEGETFYTRTYVDAGAGGYYPACAYTTLNAEGFHAGDLVDSADAWVHNDEYAFAPVAIKGAAIVRKPSVALIGDSIAFGAGDEGEAYGGFMQRAVQDLFPYTKLAVSGGRASEFIGRGSMIRSRALEGVTHAIINFGTNDFGIWPYSTLDELKANQQAIWKALHLRGIKVFVCTLLPRTNSSDGWLTVANQSQAGGQFEPGSFLDQYNAWLRTVKSPYLSGVFDTCRACESTPGSLRWRVDAQGRPLTDDGTHPNKYGYALLADAIRSEVEKFTL